MSRPSQIRTASAGAGALAIDPTLDPQTLRPLFEGLGRIHLPGFFQPQGAQAVYSSLSEETPWRRNLNSESRNVTMNIAAYEAQPAVWRADLEAAVLRQARDGFQYLFDTYPVSDEIEAGRRSGLACEAVYDFLNSEPFLDFVRRLTGDPGPVYADAQATRYLPGHFLTQHSDELEGKNRLFAYVLNFTPVWKPDWGGLLLFLDKDGHVAEGYAPKFNALNIFRVPQDHCVTQVASYAGAARYAITGWIRSRRP